MRAIGRKAWMALLAMLVLGGCGTQGSGATDGVLEGSRASLEALSAAAWQATVAGDTAAMERLRLSEREHNELAWPHLPAARPELNMPVDFAWRNLEMRNHWDRAKLLRSFRGSALRPVGAGCADTAEYGEIRVLSGCWLEVRGPGGASRRLILFDDVLQLGGEFKLFRYRGG